MAYCESRHDRGGKAKTRLDPIHRRLLVKSRSRCSTPVTDESVRGGEEHRLARLESREIRERVLSRSETLPNINLCDVGGQPPVETPGWRGAPVAYWRVPSLNHIQAELSIYTSPYREWIDSEVDV